MAWISQPANQLISASENDFIFKNVKIFSMQYSCLTFFHIDRDKSYRINGKYVDNILTVMKSVSNCVIFPPYSLSLFLLFSSLPAHFIPPTRFYSTVCRYVL